MNKKTVRVFYLGTCLGLLELPSHADNEESNKGFDADHYKTLWMHSPFTVETPDASNTSCTYALVGIARIDGIDYASLINKTTYEHFIISSAGVSSNGVRLLSVVINPAHTDYAVTISDHGNSVVLHQEAFLIPALVSTAPRQVNRTAATFPQTASAEPKQTAFNPAVIQIP